MKSRYPSRRQGYLLFMSGWGEGIYFSWVVGPKVFGSSNQDTTSGRWDYWFAPWTRTRYSKFHIKSLFYSLQSLILIPFFFLLMILLMSNKIVLCVGLVKSNSLRVRVIRKMYTFIFVLKTKIKFKLLPPLHIVNIWWLHLARTT